MKKRNRLLAILLTAILTISMLPSAAFASEAVDTGETAEAAVVEVSSVGEEQDAEATVEEVSTVEEAVEETAEAAEAEADEEAAVEAATEDAAEPAADQEAEAAEEEAAETAEAEETAEPAAEIEEEVVPEEAAETVEWPITLEAKGGDYTVTATFDESAGFPADVKLNASEISKGSDAYQSYYDQALEAVQNETDKEVKLTDARFFDITFYTEEGEVEPTGPVNVSIKYRKSIDVESKDDIHVLHFDDNEEAAPEIMDIETSGRGDKVNEISFETDGFSVYAVIGTGDNARATVRFLQVDKDGKETEIETMIVKNSDTLEELKKIIYDPGAGTVANDYAFYGWSVDDLKNADGTYYTNDYAGPEYTVDTTPKTIEEVRSYIEGLTITEGDVLNVYAMIFTHYEVEYLDRNGASLGSGSALVREKGDKTSYKVDMGYVTDDQHDFEGWVVKEGGDYIDGYPGNAETTTLDGQEVKYYENGKVLTISGDVQFSVNAPEGRWLIFDENGKGATYIAPDFVKSDETTSAPDPERMQRYGYTFLGWYTGAPSEAGGDPTGSEFAFGNHLYDKTTIYAKWKANTEASVTVIIWKQNVAGNGYDFEQSVRLLHEPVGSTPNAVVSSGSGNSAVANVSGIAVNVETGEEEAYNKTFRWTGFHFDHTDQASQTVATEGNTVVNVYYNRNQITINFYRYQNYRWRNYKTMTGLYGSTLAENNYTWPTEYDWYDSYNWNTATGTRFTFYDAFLPPNNETTINFYADTAASGRTIYFYKQNASKTGYELANTVGVASNTNGFNLSDKYNGYKCVAWNNSNNTSNWQTVGELMTQGVYNYYDADPKTEGYQAATVNGNGLYIYYDRLEYTLNFMDGAYYNGDNVMIDEISMVESHEVHDITYGADLTSYNKKGTTYYEPEAPAGYVFECWCIDDACTTPYTFTTMPDGGLTVYAKWRQIQYRVFLRPCAGTDTSLNWGSENQAMNFRRSYNDQVSTPEGLRTGYEFLGWFLDKTEDENGNVQGGNVFYPDSLRLHEEDPTYGKYFTEYDWDKDFTDDMDKWGNGATYNKDKDNNRFWITKKLELYGKWSKKTVGADGIHVVYDAGEGTGEPIDNLVHKDNTDAVAGAASKPTDPKKVFKQWVVHTWDGSDFVPSKTVLPGEKFTVHVEDAKIVIEGTETVVTLEEAEASPNQHYTYTIKLVAEYADIEDAIPTHIPWYNNDGTKAFHIDSISDGQSIADSTLEINKEVGIQHKQEDREHYTFLGWARVEMSDDPADWEGNDQNWTQELDEDDVFLHYNAENEKFYTDREFTHEVSFVAADEATPYHAMFAVWKKNPGYYVYRSITDKEPIFYEMPESGTVNLLDLIDKETYLYGGYYNTNENLEKLSACTDYPGTALVPEVEKVYYLKELPNTYLKPQIYLIYSHARLIKGLYGFVNVDDDDDYEEYGLIVNNTEKKRDASVSESIEFTKNNEVYDTLDASRLFKMDSCIIGVNNLTDFMESQFEQASKDERVLLEIGGYYVTKDGIKVTGFNNRMIQFDEVDERYGAPYFTGWNSEGNTNTGIKSVDQTCTPVTRSLTQHMAVTRKLMISVPSDKIEYRITKVYDSNTEEQTVEEGDYSGQITYVPKDGYMFAGWYQDEAFTEPADFSNITGDMTVYAKYVSNKDITVAFSRKSKKSNTTTFNATISVKNRDQLENVTVNVNDDISAVLANKSVKKTGSGKNVKYTTQYKGTVAVKGLSIIDTFTASVTWTTPDGTVVTGMNRNCTYILGIVTVK